MDDENGPYVCSVYANTMEENRFAYVCERGPVPLRLAAKHWRILLKGVEPPDRAKPWLKLNRYYEMHHFEESPSS